MSLYTTTNNGPIAAGILPLANGASLGQVLGGLVIGSAGFVRNMYISTQDPTGGESTTCTLYLNGAASLLVAVVNGGKVSAADVTHSIAVVAGDVITQKLTKSGGSASVSVQATIELDLV
jgi:hypothetical protein